MGVQEDPGNADHTEEREIGEKRCIWGKAGCMCVGSLVFLGTGTRGPFHATHAEEREKENFCMCDRFSADGFRTRAARVIRRRVLGFGGQRENPGKREGDVQVIPGRWENGVCV